MLAEENLDICFRLLATRAAYDGGLEMYLECVEKSLAGLLGALSGIFCELSVVQKGEQPDVELYCESDRQLGVFSKVYQYLQTCAVLLNKSDANRNALLPYTLMYLKAQTLMFEVVEWADHAPKSPRLQRD